MPTTGSGQVSRARLALGGTGAVLLLLLGLSGLATTTTGSPGTAVLAGAVAGVGVVVLLATVAELRSALDGSRVEVAVAPGGEASTYVPYAGVSVWAPAGVLLVAALAGLAGAVVAGAGGSTGGLAVGVVVGLGSLVWLAPWLTGRVRPGGVHLTPTRIVVNHQGTGWEVRWDDVLGVVPREPVAVVTSGPDVVRRSRSAPYGWSGDVRTQDSGVLGIPTRHLALDGATLGHVLAMCQDRPDLRARLGAPESLDLQLFGVTGSR